MGGGGVSGARPARQRRHRPPRSVKEKRVRSPSRLSLFLHCKQCTAWSQLVVWFAVQRSFALVSWLVGLMAWPGLLLESALLHSSGT